MSTAAAPRSLLYVFARAPEPGRTKTRLAALVGPDAAARLAAAFLEDVCAATRDTAARRVLSVSGNPAHPAITAIVVREQAAGAPLEVARQGEGDLGLRMHDAIAQGLAGAADRVAIVGSDVPILDGGDVRAAFDGLGAADVVIGPADDGGYWLVGARREVPWLFTDMPWGTASVFAESARRLDERALPWRRVTAGWDVDEPADLDRLRLVLRSHPRPLLAPSTRRALAELGLAFDA